MSTTRRRFLSLAPLAPLGLKTALDWLRVVSEAGVDSLAAAARSL